MADSSVFSADELTDKLPLKAWMIRPCAVYKSEYLECTSTRGRIHQYYINGYSNPDCHKWKEDYDNCMAVVESKFPELATTEPYSDSESETDGLHGLWMFSDTDSDSSEKDAGLDLPKSKPLDIKEAPLRNQKKGKPADPFNTKMGRPSKLKQYPGILGAAETFITHNGFSAHKRRRTDTASCGVTINNIRKDLMRSVPELKSISQSTVARLLEPPRSTSISAGRYTSSIHARVPAKQNDLVKEHQDIHFCRSQVLLFREMFSDHSNVSRSIMVAGRVGRLWFLSLRGLVSVDCALRETRHGASLS
ncbi:uncharacterized protein LOC135482676 isoform X2 [Lineus longissimus]|uniref:uncharacterized protein LOC135482676 isoform X2 n=1 Tax=Lineus longissimus TaxID=88925 RepID=UPI00315D3F37